MSLQTWERDRMNFAFPLRVLVKGETSSLRIAFEAATQDQVSLRNRVTAEPTPSGLLIHGITELDLEFVIWYMQQQVVKFTLGSPEVNFVSGPPMLEPYLRVTIRIPDATLITVSEDLASRRREIHSTLRILDMLKLTFDAPVAELFGYTADLAFLTAHLGLVETMDFGGYRPYSNA